MGEEEGRKEVRKERRKIKYRDKEGAGRKGGRDERTEDKMYLFIPFSPLKLLCFCFMSSFFLPRTK